ncbi:MAG: heme exporter protein CcmB [Gammaproteobacteria bacterium]|nr:heme exporter protein CcmB [Gammaproteobacteria bacterium]
MLFRNTATLVQPLCFFVLIALLFPLSLPAENALLQRIGGGVIWVAAVLATLLSLESMFKPDHRDGVLEQLIISPRSLTTAVLAKSLAHWSATGLVLTLFSPLLSFAFRIPAEQAWVLFISLLIGTPSLTLIGAIGAALTVTLHRGGVLLAIIILPLYIPILIFGAGMVGQSTQGAAIDSQVYALLAIGVLATTLSPFAIAASLRLTID